ncbi:MAG: hypothetical protein LC121_04865, partial [Anaerolineae bacterium]|nr:hypothetical protein [Anaerolineae bacterium]
TNSPPGEPPNSGERITPVLTVELDYGGSELVDAEDHVDVLFLDHNGGHVVHARRAARHRAAEHRGGEEP